jgi:hypothetical protein
MAPDGRTETCSWEILLKIHFNNYLIESCVRLIFYIILLLKHNGEISPESSTPCVCLHGVDTHFVFTVYACYVFLSEF